MPCAALAHIKQVIVNGIGIGVQRMSPWIWCQCDLFYPHSPVKNSITYQKFDSLGHRVSNSCPQFLHLPSPSPAPCVVTIGYYRGGTLVLVVVAYISNYSQMLVTVQ